MKKSLAAIAAGSFALGFAEFVMMGILTDVALGMNVTVPQAGTFISAYAAGVCAGTLFLVFGRNVPPKSLLLMLVVLIVAGNAIAASAPNAATLTIARFVSGLPHGAFFGTATIVAKQLADPGREGRAVSIMVLGQTLANMIGVPGGTLLANLVGWRAAFAFVAAWAVVSFVLILRWVPAVDPIRDAGLAGQFRFLKKPGPWLIIGAVLLGNTGIFCWWSFVSPWLTSIGGYAAAAVPALLVLAGLGMVAGSLAGGRLSDKTTPGKMSACGQAVSCIGLVFAFLFAGTPLSAAVIMFVCSFGLFFVSSPQQLLMVKVGHGGGEMIGSACVQVAFNLGNAFGASIGQAVLTAGATYASPSLAGAPFCLLAAALLTVFFAKFERLYDMRDASDAALATEAEAARPSAATPLAGATAGASANATA